MQQQGYKKDICGRNYITDKFPPDWDNFVLAHGQGNIYQTSTWNKVIKTAFPHITGYLILIKHKNIIRAGLPIYFVKSRLTGNRLVSVPFGLVSNPIADDKGDVELILKVSKILLNDLDARFIEIRTNSNQEIACDFKPSYFFKIHYLRLRNDPEDLKKQFKKNVYYGLNKAYKSKLSLKEATDLNELKEFYNILAINRRLHGLPLIPFKFFEAMWRHFYGLNQLKLFLAIKDNAVVGGNLVLVYKDSVISEYKCSKRELRRSNIDYFLDWETIKWALERGFNIYSFGRTASNNHGLLFYKSRWGTIEEDLPIYYYPPSYGNEPSERYNSLKFKLAKGIFRYSPQPLARLLGEFIYKHMG